MPPTKQMKEWGSVSLDVKRMSILLHGEDFQDIFRKALVVFQKELTIAVPKVKLLSFTVE